MDSQAEAKNPPEDFPKWPFEYFRFQFGRDKPDEARNVLLVVATLITAVTFQAGLNPPGGVWQDDSSGDDSAGKSILAFRSALGFTIFLYGNTLAFSASGTLITFLVHGCPFSMEVQIALFSMGFTSSIVSVMPPGSAGINLVLFFLALLIPYLLRYASQLKKKYCWPLEQDQITQLSS